jgi:hypothetical protein
VKLTLAVLVPTSPGVKVTLSVQLAPAARVLGQLFVAAKSPASVPEVVILEMVYATPSLLVRIAVSGVEVVL